MVAWISLIVPMLALILIGIFVPESPIWLVEKGFFDLADNVIHFLGRDEDEFATEVNTVCAQLLPAVSIIFPFYNMSAFL